MKTQCPQVSGHSLTEVSAENPSALPQVSVIIPHFNDLENLKVCLQRLSQQTLASHQFEVIIAENNSAVGIEVVRETVNDAACNCRTQVVAALEQGAAAARNAGVLAAQGEILAFIDSDCRPAPDWLANGLKSLQSRPAKRDFAPEVTGECPDLIGGRIQVASAIPNRLSAVEAFEAVFAFNNAAYVRKKSFSVTANLLTRRSVFEVVGGFRSGVSEDKDWCLRAVRQGYVIGYAEDALVQHPARQTWAALAKKWQRLLHEDYRLTIEHPLGHLIWLARSWGVLLSPLVHGLKVLTSPELQRFEERWGAIAILFRIRFYRFWQAHRIFFNDSHLEK